MADGRHTVISLVYEVTQRTRDMKMGDIAVILESPHKDQIGKHIMRTFWEHTYVDLSNGSTWSQIDPNFGVRILKPGETVTITVG